MESGQCPRCGGAVSLGQNFCPSCGLALREADAEPAKAPKSKRDKRRLRPRTIRLAGQLIGTLLSGVVTGLIVLVMFYGLNRSQEPKPVSVTVIMPTAFGERTPRGLVNASALVPVADSRFLVVDDLTDDAFFELRFGTDGSKSGPLVRRPVSGLAPGSVEDFEGASLVEEAGRKFVVAISSLEEHEGENTGAGLVRVSFGEGDELRGEAMSGFREWLVTNFPELSASGANLAELNAQGIAWDPKTRSLLIGLRYPTDAGGPLVLSVRVKDWSGAWETSNLERGGVTVLGARPRTAGAPTPGVLDLARAADTGGFFVILGDSTGRPRNSVLYTWDGGQGALAPIPGTVFHPDMKPEGIALGTIGGRKAVVVVDDGGGYYVLWSDELSGV